jgi:hypothetical protein
MATRMQQRRGTAAQWISTNNGDGPVLNAGEIGFEIDNNRFKIGDGINHWVDLPYFSDNQSLSDLIDGAPDLLNTLGELATAIGEDPDFVGTVTEHTSATTDVHGIADTDDLATKDYVADAIDNSTVDQSTLAGDGLAWDAANSEFDVDNTIARVNSPTFTGTVSGITKTMVGLGNVDNTSDEDKPISTLTQSAIDLKADINSPAFTGTVTGITKAMVGLGNVSNTSDADKPLSTAATTALNLKAPIAGPVFTGTTTTDNLIVDGDFTVNGTNFSASATSITIEDNMLQLAHENAANTVDLGLVVSYNYTGSAGMHAGIVRDVSENTWKLFKNVEAEPSTTVDFANGELDNLTLGALNAASAVIGGVSDIEIQYLNGVTSAIQDQLDDKLESTTASSTYAPIESPTFTGTVAGVTKAHVGLGNVDNTADADKDISTATQTALDGKASLSGATFTGPVAGISKSMVGLGNAENTADLDKPISTATQTALDAKLSSSTASTTYAPIASPTFTGTVAGITKTMVGLANVDNTSDANKPVSTDTQAALDLKANLNGPTFTGTVAGITKSMVGLANVDNTADADKPISDDTQTALDAKLASSTAASTYAPIANPTFTGTVAGVTKAHVGLGNVDNTSDANKPVSTAQQTALDLKAPKADPTFTGTATTSDLVVNGDFTVNGTNFSASATSITIEDNMLQLAHQNAANTVDLGLVVGYNDGAAKHAGLVRDVSDAKWKLFAGVTTEPTTTVNFAQGSLDALAVGALEATTVTPSSGVVFSDGTQTKAAAPSLVAISQKVADYTLSSLTERDSMIEMNSASATTLTVAPNSSVAYPVGTSIDILRVGAGAVTVAAGAGVTLNFTPGNKLRAQWSSATLVKRATDTWVLLGDLSV